VIPRSLQIAAGLLLVAVFGMGFYVLRTKRRAEMLEARTDQRPVAPPVSGPVGRAVLFVAHDDTATLERRELQIALPTEPAERAREALRAVLAIYQERPSPHAIGAGADVRAVYLVKRNMAVVDTTPDFANHHPSGVLAESLTIASLAETLAANTPGITQVKFLVDGRERETLAGHADLSGFYDVSAMGQQ